MTLHGAMAIVFAALVLGGCAGAPARQGDTVLQLIDITNRTAEPVRVTARVGASAEQRLGLLGPGEYHRFEIPTGAASTGDIFLAARNDQTGNQATTTLQVTAGQTLRWDIRF